MTYHYEDKKWEFTIRENEVILKRKVFDRYHDTKQRMPIYKVKTLVQGRLYNHEIIPKAILTLLKYHGCNLSWINRRRLNKAISSIEIFPGVHPYGESNRYHL